MSRKSELMKRERLELKYLDIEQRSENPQKNPTRKQPVSPKEKSMIKCLRSQQRSWLTTVKYKMSSSEAFFTRRGHQMR